LQNPDQAVAKDFFAKKSVLQRFRTLWSATLCQQQETASSLQKRAQILSVVDCDDDAAVVGGGGNHAENGNCRTTTVKLYARNSTWWHNYVATLTIHR
jgi:hypothetical protein